VLALKFAHEGRLAIKKAGAVLRESDTVGV